MSSSRVLRGRKFGLACGEFGGSLVQTKLLCSNGQREHGDRDADGLDSLCARGVRSARAGVRQLRVIYPGCGSRSVTARTCAGGGEPRSEVQVLLLESGERLKGYVVFLEVSESFQ